MKIQPPTDPLNRPQRWSQQYQQLDTINLKSNAELANTNVKLNAEVGLEHWEDEAMPMEIQPSKDHISTDCPWWSQQYQGKGYSAETV